MPKLQDALNSLSATTLERIKYALMDSSASIGSSLLSFLVSFLSVSLTIDYLGDERFGVWMTVASISAMLSFLDLGVGNGLVSQIAKSNASSNTHDLQNTVTRGLVTLSIIGLTIYILLFLLNNSFPVANGLNIETSVAKADADSLITAFIILFSLNIPLNGILKIIFGLQKGWMVHISRLSASLLSLSLLIYLSEREADPYVLFIATYGVQTLAPLCFLPYFLKKKLLTAHPNRDKHGAIVEYKKLISVGWLFLILQIGVMVGWGADAYLISALSSVSAVAQFAIVQRLFQFVSIPVNILNNPLWGAYADAYARNDINFIQKALKISLLGTLVISSSLSAAVYLFSDYILGIWINDKVTVSGQLLLAFAVWKVLQSVGHSFSMALNGMHIVTIQAYSVLFLCLLALPLKLYFAPQYGAAAVVWSTVAAYTISTVFFYIFIFRKVIYSHLFAQR